jgi:hypothetical protein
VEKLRILLGAKRQMTMIQRFIIEVFSNETDRNAADMPESADEAESW